MSTPTQQPPYPLRMPDDLRARLTEIAKANGRSLNAEIVAMLQHAVENRPNFDAEEFAEDLAVRIAKHLKGK